ncbi:MAG: type II secretion system F family protein [Candidatus Thermoplasmatota archaeon]|nr:type II secretion system F family protein [Candidatus Thermoplasmatota archaeon]MBU1940550.1 type II secretion system F family protein [Candidatus Thermoplasmatota archaeon]
MKSSKYSRFCRKLFAGLFAQLNVSESSKNRLLEKADISMVYQEYYAMVLMNIIIGFIVSFLSTLFLYTLVPNDITALLIFLVTSLIPVIIGIIYIQLPAYRTKQRAKNIDRFLPYVTNFVNTMSAAGISPSEIFGTLSSIKLYGELQKEAKKITTEIELMGIDTITALKNAIAISPSHKFKEFLQGIIGVIQSGSELAPYFERCVERYMYEDLQDRKKNLDSLAVMAESFVVTVIAFPLFLVIIISIMGLTSGGISFDFLYILAVMILPMAYLGFYIMMKSGMGEDV